MRAFHRHFPSQVGIDRPLCAKCGTRTWLTLIEPADVPNCDKRTFDCPGCGRSEDIIVEINRPPSQNVSFSVARLFGLLFPIILLFTVDRLHFFDG